MMIQETIATNLEWVVFSDQPENDDTCQRQTFDCPNEAVSEIVYDKACCTRKQTRICVSCMSEGFRPGREVACSRCCGSKLIISVHPVRG